MRKTRVTRVIPMRVDAEVWKRFSRYVWRRKGQGNSSITIGRILEAALEEYMKRHRA